MQLNSRNDAAYWAKVPGLSGSIQENYLARTRRRKRKEQYSIIYY